MTDTEKEIQEIWALFRETHKMFKENARKEAERSREIDRKFEETDRRIAEKFRETDRMFRENAKKEAERWRKIGRKFEETDKESKELRELFTGQWGKLVEALVEPSVLRLFQERNIPVLYTAQRVKPKKDKIGMEIDMEIDILAVNDDSVIAVEVKTTLKVSGVNEHLERLKHFMEVFPRYKGMKLYGAVAGVNIEEKADRYAYKNGLFVLTLSGENMVVILNDEKFIPKDFADEQD